MSDRMSDAEFARLEDITFDVASEAAKRMGRAAYREARRARTREAELEREVERLRAFVGKLARLETRPHDAETWNGRALVVIRDDARAALPPPKETP